MTGHLSGWFFMLLFDSGMLKPPFLSSARAAPFPEFRHGLLPVIVFTVPGETLRLA
jgi:hypothetical protein